MATRKLFEQDSFLDTAPNSSGQGWEDNRLAYGRVGSVTRNLTWGNFLNWLKDTFLPTYFLTKSNNLSELSNTASLARDNLVVYSKSQVDNYIAQISANDRIWVGYNYESQASAANTFETKTDAANTFETKTDANLLQSILQKYKQYLNAGGPSIGNTVEIDVTLANKFHIIVTDPTKAYYNLPPSPSEFTEIEIIVPDSTYSVKIIGDGIKGLGSGKLITLNSDDLGSSMKFFAYQGGPTQAWMITNANGTYTIS